MCGVDQVAALVEQNAVFAEAVRGKDVLRQPVPSCPEWTVRDLVTHLTEVQSFWRLVLLAGGELPPDPVLVPAGSDAAVVARWHRAADQLVETLRDLPPDAPTWAWWAADKRATVAAVGRRMAHEALIHRWDAQRAVGRTTPFGAELAADGIADFAMTHLRSGTAWTGPSGVVQLFAEDIRRAWLIGVGTVPGVRGGLPTWLTDKRLRPVDAQVTGTAEELDLALWGRIPLAELRVAGDRPLAAALLAWPGTE